MKRIAGYQLLHGGKHLSAAGQRGRRQNGCRRCWWWTGRFWRKLWLLWRWRVLFCNCVTFWIFCNISFSLFLFDFSAGFDFFWFFFDFCGLFAAALLLVIDRFVLRGEAACKKGAKMLLGYITMILFFFFSFYEPFHDPILYPFLTLIANLEEKNVFFFLFHPYFSLMWIF